MNKKLISAAALTAALLLGTLTACGDAVSQPDSAATNANSSSSEAAADSADTSGNAAAAGVSFQFAATAADGSEYILMINGDADAMQTALGTPSETFEAPSCAFDGTSYTYTYSGFTVETYPSPDDGSNLIYAITLKDSSVQTHEGAKVGDSADTIRSLCGEPDNETAAYLMYKGEGEGEALQFFLEGDAVSSIVYTYM